MLGHTGDAVVCVDEAVTGVNGAPAYLIGTSVQTGPAVICDDLACGLAVCPLDTAVWPAACTP